MKKNFLFVLMIATFAPLSSASATTPSPSPSPMPSPAPVVENDKARDLTIQDLKNAKISVVMVGATPENDNWATTVSLTGSISPDCLGHFEISNHQNNAEVASKGLGFRIRDLDGTGLSCMKKGCRGSGCLHLSRDVPEAKVDLSADKSGEIQLVQIFDGDELMPNRIIADPMNLLNQDLPAHRSKKDIEKEAKAQAARERQERVEDLQNTMSTCRKSPAGLPVARKAARALFDLNGDSSSYRKFITELELDELNFMLKATLDLKTSQADLETLRQDIHNFRMSHPPIIEIGDGIMISINKIEAEALVNIAKRMVNKKDKATGKSLVTLDDFKVAREILHEAISDESLPSETVARIQSDIDANESGFLAAYGQAIVNTQDPSALEDYNKTFAETAGRLYQRAMEACSGESRSVEGCSMARSAYNSVLMIPERIRKIQEQKFLSDQKAAHALAPLNGGGQQQMQQIPMTVPIQNQIPMTQGNSWVPYQSQRPASVPFAPMGMAPGGLPIGMSAGMPGVQGGGAWSGGTYGRPQTF